MKVYRFLLNCSIALVVVTAACMLIRGVGLLDLLAPFMHVE